MQRDSQTCRASRIRRWTRSAAVWIFSCAAVLLPTDVFAAFVSVREQVSRDGAVTVVATFVRETGCRYRTSSAPAEDGYVFIGWTISPQQKFEPRDLWGRPLDAATYEPSEETVLTANYVSADLDSDGDGLADGLEYYWYGNLDEDADSDTDGDGMSFAQEIAGGFNPLLRERTDDDRVEVAESVRWQYNPYGYPPYVIRSEPEGALFETVRDYVRPGASIDSYTGDPKTTAFAYWQVEGVRQADIWGRSVDSFSLAMPSSEVELVAVAKESENEKWKLYWYGSLDVAMDSDTDGDGMTFAEEIAAGTNPRMAERHEDEAVAYADSERWQYNPRGYPPYVLKSDPEGALFETTVDYVRAGEGVMTEVLDPAKGFACWMIDGVEQRDIWGRAMESVALQMPTKTVTIVAKAVADPGQRMSLYWYGNTTTAMDSDTDGDGMTFAEEIAAGTNPRMAERHAEGPVTYADWDVSRGAGGSVPTDVEPIDGDRPTFTVGSAKFFWNDVNVGVGETVGVLLSIENARDGDLVRKAISVRFDPAVLSFVTVAKTGLSEDLVLADACVNGTVTVKIDRGESAAGSGKFLSYVFTARKAGVTKVGGATVTIGDGARVPFVRGDLDGDGDVDSDDLKAMAEFLEDGECTATSDQLKAGDFNGNGRLDTADYQSLRTQLR